MYPEEIYSKKKIYGILVNVSQHPELNEYIKNILSAVKNLIQKNEKNFNHINLTFLSQNNEPLENFMLSIQSLKENNFR